MKPTSSRRPARAAATSVLDRVGQQLVVGVDGEDVAPRQCSRPALRARLGPPFSSRRRTVMASSASSSRSASSEPSSSEASSTTIDLDLRVGLGSDRVDALAEEAGLVEVGDQDRDERRFALGAVLEPDRLRAGRLRLRLRRWHRRIEFLDRARHAPRPSAATENSALAPARAARGPGPRGSRGPRPAG